MTTSREQFEAWFKREIIETEDFQFNAFNDEDNEYTVGEDDNEDLYLNIQAMFMAWQASRAIIVVELPAPYDDGHGNLWFPQDATTERICAAGITVKGDSDA